MTNADRSQWIGRRTLDSEGERIGALADVYVDDATGDTEWLAVHTGLFGTRISFVPARDSEERDGVIHVAWTKDMVKEAPRIEVDGEMSVEEEERLYAHYGLNYRADKPDQPSDPDAYRETGSTSAGSEVRPEVALARLRRRDENAVAAIDLDLDESKRA